MGIISRTAIVAVGSTVTAICLGAPAAADPADDPCGLNPICALLPVVPNLDHDVDLTKDPNALSGKPDAGSGSPGPQTP